LTRIQGERILLPCNRCQSQRLLDALGVHIAGGIVHFQTQVIKKASRLVLSLPLALMHCYVELRYLARSTAFPAGRRFILYLHYNITERIP
jgi:hypothetical protein